MCIYLNTFMSGFLGTSLLPETKEGRAVPSRDHYTELYMVREIELCCFFFLAI